ncbi:hypothetical protein, partial [Polaribacter atrinae]|uniref:hypothetical protein n=1 Tax=Polaribacter atrinae TaxID=1333662 RepID=UPI0024906CEF
KRTSFFIIFNKVIFHIFGSFVLWLMFLLNVLQRVACMKSCEFVREDFPKENQKQANEQPLLVKPI